MATATINYRPATQADKPGSIFYQVTHNRMSRRIPTDYHIMPSEWDDTTKSIIITSGDRRKILQQIARSTTDELHKLRTIIANRTEADQQLSIDDIVRDFHLITSPGQTFFLFIEGLINRMHRLGRHRSAETYTSALLSFRRFRNDCDIHPSEITTEMIETYESFLKDSGVCPNSSSFYMRILRAAYNRAVDTGLTQQRTPFRHVYTGVEKTAKRAITICAIRRIRTLTLLRGSTTDFARDMFMFSFYTRGMSFVDMAYLRKKDLSNGIITYRRRKTNQQLLIKWEQCMQEIVDKHPTNPDSPYLLPIIDPTLGNERMQYLVRGHNINRRLKAIGAQVGLTLPLTMYVARHAWASIARSNNIPLSVISEGMGHDSESTTRIYLATLDNIAVDRANRQILQLALK